MRTVFNALLLEPFDGILWMGEEYLSSHEGSTAQREELHGNDPLISIYQCALVVECLILSSLFSGLSWFLLFSHSNPLEKSIRPSS